MLLFPSAKGEALKEVAANVAANIVQPTILKINEFRDC
jgi:hypothetical protein